MFRRVLHFDSEAVSFDGAKNGTPNFFIGDVDDVRIYHRASSAEEVAGMAGRADPVEQALGCVGKLHLVSSGSFSQMFDAAFAAKAARRQRS